MNRLICCVCMFFFVLSPSVFAWNALGHMVTADIAYQNLKPSARKQIDNLVEYFAREYPKMGSIMQMAYWPDAIRMQRIESFDHWHYIDMPFSGDGTQLKNTIDTDNAIWAAKTITNFSKNDKANYYERARFLCFLIHIIGDLHQPLHTVTRISAANPDGDQGGNLYYIFYKNKRAKLHSAWDEGLGVLEGENTADRAHSIATTITGLYPASYFGKKINNLDFDKWAEEGMKNSRLYVYNTPEGEEVSPQYVSTGRQIAQQQLALAGYRTAKLLNTLFGS